MGKRREVRIINEGPDYEREVAKRPLTDQQIKDNLPSVWKERAENAKRQVSVPIPKSVHHT